MEVFLFYFSGMILIYIYMAILDCVVENTDTNSFLEVTQNAKIELKVLHNFPFWKNTSFIF